MQPRKEPLPSSDEPARGRTSPRIAAGSGARISQPPRIARAGAVVDVVHRRAGKGRRVPVALCAVAHDQGLLEAPGSHPVSRTASRQARAHHAPRGRRCAGSNRIHKPGSALTSETTSPARTPRLASRIPTANRPVVEMQFRNRANTSAGPARDTGPAHRAAATARNMHRGKRCVVYMHLPLRSSKFLSANRHGNSTHCAVCGAALHPKRASRRQRFCSDRCRDEHRRTRNFAKKGRTRYPNSGGTTIKRKSREKSSAWRSETVGRLPAISWSEIIEIEVIEAHDWEPVISSDGVKSWRHVVDFPRL